MGLKSHYPRNGYGRYQEVPLTQKSEYRIGTFGAAYFVFRAHSEEWWRFRAMFMDRRQAEDYVEMLTAQPHNDPAPLADAPLGLLLGRGRAAQPKAPEPPEPAPRLMPQFTGDEPRSNLSAREQRMLAAISELYTRGHRFTVREASQKADVTEGSMWHVLHLLKTKGFVDLDRRGVRPTGKPPLPRLEEAPAEEAAPPPVVRHRLTQQKKDERAEMVWKAIQALTAEGSATSYVTVSARVGMSAGSIFPYVQMLKAKGLITTHDARYVQTAEERAEIYRSGGIRMVRSEEPIDRIVMPRFPTTEETAAAPVSVVPEDPQLAALREPAPGPEPFNPALSQETTGWGGPRRAVS